MNLSDCACFGRENGKGWMPFSKLEQNQKFVWKIRHSLWSGFSNLGYISTTPLLLACPRTTESDSISCPRNLGTKGQRSGDLFPQIYFSPWFFMSHHNFYPAQSKYCRKRIGPCFYRLAAEKCTVGQRGNIALSADKAK